MTNKERQKSLEKKKWIRSEIFHLDLSGSMLYCDFCKHQNVLECSRTQEERESECFCAKAYNRMMREKCKQNGKVDS